MNIPSLEAQNEWREAISAYINQDIEFSHVAKELIPQINMETGILMTENEFRLFAEGWGVGQISCSRSIGIPKNAINRDAKKLVSTFHGAYEQNQLLDFVGGLFTHGFAGISKSVRDQKRIPEAKELIFRHARGLSDLKDKLTQYPETAYIGGRRHILSMETCDVNSSMFPDIQDKNYFSDTYDLAEEIIENTKALVSQETIDGIEAGFEIEAILQKSDSAVELLKQIKNANNEEEIQNFSYCLPEFKDLLTEIELSIDEAAENPDSAITKIQDAHLLFHFLLGRFLPQR
ncbi:MAG: hypothetical protein LBK99_16505 [Opitutaceae bacterium]|jgi:hypothetical protein|nr:hypothetical protein [Opitutaceae bacterium]